MEHTQVVQHVDLAGWPDQQPAVAVEPAVKPVAVTGEFVSRVELPSGGWAELADPKKIRSKHRKLVMDRLNIDRMQQRTVGVAFDVTEGLMLMMVEKWHVPYFPDVARPLDDVSVLDELEIPDYDALAEALEPAREMLFPAPPSVDGARTPGSPTRPGGA